MMKELIEMVVGLPIVIAGCFVLMAWAMLGMMGEAILAIGSGRKKPEKPVKTHPTAYQGYRRG